MKFASMLQRFQSRASSKLARRKRVRREPRRIRFESLEGRQLLATYYVNDASLVNDNWCSAVGNDANSGLDAAHPKATVQSVLSSYALNGDDRIRVDTGTYTLTSDIQVTTSDDGTAGHPMVIEGSPYGVTINRNATVAGADAFEIAGDYVTITTAASSALPSVPQKHMKITGANRGVNITGNQAILSSLDISGNSAYGVYATGVAANQTTIENAIVNSPDAGVAVASVTSKLTLTNSTLYGSGSYQLRLTSGTAATLKNNIIYAKSGSYGIYGNASTLASSDYNDLYASVGGYVGYWGANKTTLAQWQAATGTDANSISADPLFATLGSDFHLKSTAGRYNPATGLFVTDSVYSPAIDKGNPADAYANEPAPNGSRINLGAYGNSVQASKSDAVSPTVVTKTPDAGYPLRTSSTNVDVTFSEYVTGVDATDLVLSGSAAGGASVGTPTNTSGNTWRFPVSGLVTGSLDLSLAPDADDILDPAGNDVAPPVNWSLTVDTVARNVALIVDPAGGCAVIDTLGTKNVSGYEITSPSGQLVPAGWTPTGLSGWEVLAGTATSLSEANFTGSSAFTGQLPIGSLFTIGGTQDLTFSWIDDASNLYTSAVYYQDLAPVVLSVTPAGGFSTNLSAIDVDVTFSEAVTGVDSTDLALSGGAAGGAAVGTPTNTAGNTWRFPVSGLVTGTLNLSLAPDAGDIVEASGGSLYVANKTWSYTIDTTPPTATVTPADGALLNSATIDIDVSFGEAVTGVQAADLVLAGAAAAGASVGTPVNTSGNTWRFPVSGLTDGDLDASIASGAITDLAGNNYAGFANSYTVDLTAPTAILDASTTFYATSATIDVTFSEDVDASLTSADLLVDNGTVASLVRDGLTNTYHINLTGLTEGALNVSLGNAANEIEDTAGNDLALTSQSYTVDLTSRTVTLAVDPNGGYVVLTLQGVASQDISGYTIASASNQLVPGNWDTIAPADGFAVLSSTAGLLSEASLAGFTTLAANLGVGGIFTIPGGTQDLTFQWLDASSNVHASIVTYTDLAPVVSGVAGTPVSPPGSQLTLHVTFSEAVTGVDQTDLVLSGTATTAATVVGTPTNTSGNTWSFPISGLKTGDLDFTVAPDAGDIQDSTLNDLAVYSSTIAVSDADAPTVTTVTPADTSTINSSSFVLSLTFNEAVSGLDASDIELGGAAAGGSPTVGSPTNVSGNTWEWTIGGLLSGALTVDVAPDAADIADLSGNDLAPLSLGYTITDTTAPTVTAKSPADLATVGGSSSLDVDVTFSEAVVGVGAGDLVLSGAASAGASVGAPSNTSGNTWRFPISGLATSGTLNLSLAPTLGDITDIALNDLANVTWTYEVDLDAPTATVTPADAAYLNSHTVNVDVAFNEAVTSVEAGDMVLSGAASSGASVGTPVNTSGNTWQFPITLTTDGALHVAVASGAITDAVGNAFAGFSRDYTIDTAAPTATAFAPADGSWIAGTSFDFDVTFSESVGTSPLAGDVVLSGAAAAGASVGAPTNTSGNTWRWAVSGLTDGGLTVALASPGNIADLAANPLGGGPYSRSYSVDATAPTVTSKSPAPAAVITIHATNVEVTFSEPVVNFTEADLVLGGPAAASAVKGTIVDLGGNSYRIPVTGLVSGALDLTVDGDVQDAHGLDLAAVNWAATVNLPVMVGSGIDVQKGAAQRSYVRYLDLLFDDPAGLADLISSGRILLANKGMNGLGNTPVSLAGRATVSGNNVAIDFGVQGIGGDRNGTAGNGYYELTADLNGDGVFETTKHFFRVLGDLTGDRRVNLADFGLLKLHYGTTNALGDTNGDGTVNLQDFANLKKAYGAAVAAGLPVDD